MGGFFTDGDSEHTHSRDGLMQIYENFICSGGGV